MISYFEFFLHFLSVQNFAVELQIETADELNYEFFREAVHKAGGANYGTGVRELWLFLNYSSVQSLLLFFFSFLPFHIFVFRCLGLL